MEVELVLEGLPENLLKLISVEGSSHTLPNLSKFLKLGALLQATVLESLPEKNKAIIKISNKQSHIIPMNVRLAKKHQN